MVLVSANGVTVTRSGNQYTFTSSKMIADTVNIRMKKNVPAVNGNLLIWGRPGKQTMMCGSDDPVVFAVNLQTETYGTAKIIKAAEDGNISGIRFRITGKRGG